MSSTNKTPNYGLDQYIGSDKPTYLVDYNGDMLKIDTAIHTAATSADSAVATANSAVEQVGAIGTKAQNALDTANTANTTANNAVVIANNTTKIAGDAQVDAHAALTQSNTAIETANKASEDVGTILPQVTEAVNTANAASQTVKNVSDFNEAIFTPDANWKNAAKMTLLYNVDKSIATFKGYFSDTSENGLKIPLASTVFSSVVNPNTRLFASYNDPNNILGIEDDVLIWLGVELASVTAGSTKGIYAPNALFGRKNNTLYFCSDTNFSTITNYACPFNLSFFKSGIIIQPPDTDSFNLMMFND